VGIGEETSRVGLDLSELETSAGIDWWVGAGNVDTGREGTLQAAL